MGALVWIILGLFLLTFAALVFREIKSKHAWEESASDVGQEVWVPGGLGVFSVCMGVRRFAKPGTTSTPPPGE
jgi:hypothetical protein